MTLDEPLRGVAAGQVLALYEPTTAPGLPKVMAETGRSPHDDQPESASASSSMNDSTSPEAVEELRGGAWVCLGGGAIEK